MSEAAAKTKAGFETREQLEQSFARLRHVMVLTWMVCLLALALLVLAVGVDNFGTAHWIFLGLTAVHPFDSVLLYRWLRHNAERHNAHLFADRQSAGESGVAA